MNTKLKRYINNLGITTRDFAGICGISEGRMYAYAGGEDIPKRKAIKIKKWLEFLMSEKSKEFPSEIKLEELLIHNIIEVEK